MGRGGDGGGGSDRNIFDREKLVEKASLLQRWKTPLIIAGVILVVAAVLAVVG
jgi:hypothetical protein